MPALLVLPMPPFTAVYPDSNILIKAGWPEVSTELKNVLSLARVLKLDVFLLEPVEAELEAHWTRDLRKTQMEAAGKTENLSQVLADVGLSAELKFPDDKEVLARYRAKVEEVIGLGMQRVLGLTGNLGELFEMAIQQAKPFKEKGKGFQDAVILLTAANHLAKSKHKAGALVSRDDVFTQETVRRVAEAKGTSLFFYENLDAVYKLLLGEIAEKLKGFWEQDRKAAIAASTANLPAIEEFIVRNLEIPERILFTEIIRLDKVEAVAVTKAETPLPFERSKEEPFKFSIDVAVRLHVVMRRGPSPWPETRALRVGEQPSPRSAVFEALTALQRVPEEGILERTVEVVLTAPADADYPRAEPLSVKLK